MMRSSANVEKPKDWPANDRERLLDEFARLLKSYIAHPSYRTKDELVHLSCNYEYSQKAMLGMCRVTDYEVCLINDIYKTAHNYAFSFLTSRLYEMVADVAMLENMAWKMSPIIPGLAQKPGPCVDAFFRLLDPLRLFYFAYQEYICCKQAGFAKYLVRAMRNVYDSEGVKGNLTQLKLLSISVSLMLMDLSFLRGTLNEVELQFSRKELRELLGEEARLMDLAGLSPCEHPSVGVLNIQIANFILRSRSGYHSGVSYKCIHSEAAEKSWENGQLWLRKTELLNDDREGACVRELLEELPKTKYSWLKSFDLKPTRRYWVSSFTKTSPSMEFQKTYGHAVYGFKGDRSAEIIAPLMKRHWVREDGNAWYDDYALSQVVCMDVLYGKTKAKAELKFLCSVVDRFQISANEKQAFLESILQYWLLSVKDSCWKNENERRYVLFDHMGDEYLDVEEGSGFLKIKTSLLLCPDFVIPPHPVIQKLRGLIWKKIRKEKPQRCQFCSSCLNREYGDSLFGNSKNRCPICGAETIAV